MKIKTGPEELDARIRMATAVPNISCSELVCLILDAALPALGASPEPQSDVAGAVPALDAAIHAATTAMRECSIDSADFVQAGLDCLMNAKAIEVGS